MLSHIQRMQQPNLEAAQGQTDTSVVGYRPLTELLLKGPGPARAAVLHSLFDNIGKPVDSPDTRPLWLLQTVRFVSANMLAATLLVSCRAGDGCCSRAGVLGRCLLLVVHF